MWATAALHFIIFEALPKALQLSLTNVLKYRLNLIVSDWVLICFDQPQENGPYCNLSLKTSLKSVFEKQILSRWRVRTKLGLGL